MNEGHRFMGGSSHLPSILISFAVTTVFFGASPARAASYRSDNFAVEASSKQVAREVAQAAEQCRRRLCAQWLGKKAAEWSDVCVIEVDVDSDRRFGATRFAYGSEGWSGARITLKGPLDQLLTRVLPHEVTHAVLMLHFGRPIPRWADEGAAILAEDRTKHNEYDRMVLRLVERKRAYSLDYLLKSREYPTSLDVFYSQSYSLTRFLVGLRGRKAFLAFLEHGMDYDWDDAVRTHYGYDDIDALEQAWRKHLKVVQTRLTAGDIAARVAVELPAFASSLWAAQSWATLTRIMRPVALSVRAEPVFGALPQ